MRTPRFVWGLWAGLLAGAVILNAGTSYAQDEVQELKEQVTQQQKQIEDLRKALDEEKELLKAVLAKIEAQPAHAAELKPAEGVEVASTVAMAPSHAAEAAPATSPEALNAVRGELATVAATAAQTDAKVASLETAFKDSQKSTDGLKKQLGNFSLSGDVRVRYENFIQENTQTRNRQRFRARLNLTGNVTDDIFGGVSIASGGLDDPISTNQTETSFFTRKTVAIDKAYLTINPRGFRQLSLTGGKQAYSWYRTELTFDNDLNPEGFSEKLSLNSKSFLKNVTFVGYQNVFNESSGGPDGSMIGGQLQLKFNAGKKGRFELYGGATKFYHADSIAVAQSKGALANSLTNTLARDTGGNVTGYAGEFLYVLASARAGYDLAPKWPFDVGFDFVNNSQAASSQRKGYLAEASIGQEKNPKDVKVGYKYYRIEKDAVISAFNFSDLRTATDVQNHVFFVGYQIIKNVSGEWTYLLGKRLNDPADSWLSRMQFDLVYKF